MSKSAYHVSLQAAMAPKNEAERVAALEQIRTPKNGEIIDQAITSGKTAGDVAYKIAKDENEALKAVD